MRTMAAVTAGAVPLALGVGTASADEAYSQFFFKDHSFTRGDGAPVTCSIAGDSSLFRRTGEDAFQAEALTDASGDDAACGVTFVEVIATYQDTSGRRKTTGANSIDGDVQWFSDDVAGGFSVVHRVSFEDCRANCEVSVTTSPK